jgi:hypothetical protein
MAKNNFPSQTTVNTSTNPTKRAGYNRIMDKLLKKDWSSAPFSQKFGNFKLLQLSDQHSQPKGIDGEFMNKRNDYFPTVAAETIDFNDESISSSWKNEEESSTEYNDGEEDPLKEVDVKYTPGKNFQCPVKSCKKVYTSSYGLKYHMDHGHTLEKISEKRPYACPIDGCGKTYKNNNGLKYHISHAHKGVTYVESEFGF